MKINLIGAYGVEGMHTTLAEILRKYGVEAAVNNEEYEKFDFNMFMGLWNLTEKKMNNFNVAYGCGSDIWRDWENLKETRLPLLKKCNFVLYGHPDMQNVTGVPGEFWHVPFDKDLFSIQPSMRMFKPHFDCLLYAPSPQVYCLDEVMKYVEYHPEQKFILLGGGYENLISADPPENLLIYPHILYRCMPWMYCQCREFRLWLSHPATPVSSMEAEALHMGLKVFRNDQEVTEIPKYMFMEEAIPRLLHLLQ